MGVGVRLEMISRSNDEAVSWLQRFLMQTMLCCQTATKQANQTIKQPQNKRRFSQNYACISDFYAYWEGSTIQKTKENKKPIKLKKNKIESGL